MPDRIASPHDHSRVLEGRRSLAGLLQAYTDYWTQGDSLNDLQDHLLDLYADITSGTLPTLRKVAELAVA